MTGLERLAGLSLALVLVSAGWGCDDGASAGALRDGGASDGGAGDGAVADLGRAPDTGPAPDARTGDDAALDAALDARTDDGVDATADGGVDATTDGGVDATADGGVDGGGLPGEVTASPAGDEASATIGASGGQITVGDGPRTYTLTVPAGALAADTTITLRPAVISGLDETVTAFTAGVMLEPSGLRFEVPAELAIGGAEVGELAIGLVFDDAGAVAWQHPQGDADRLTLAIGHFSGAALADIAPGAWGTLLELTGELPRFEIEQVAPVSLRDVPERFLCMSVTTEAGRPLPRVPVRFDLGVSPGRLVDADARTNAVGNACVRWQGAGVDPGPLGSEVVVAATGFPQAAFEGTVFSRFLFGGDVPQVRLTGLDAEQVLQAGSEHPLCAEIFFEGISPPLLGYPIRLDSSRPELISFFDASTTDAAGRYCGTVAVAADYELGEESPFVDLTAVVALRDGQEGLGLLTVQVDDPRLTVRFEAQAPARVLAGSPAVQACVVVTRGEGRAEGLAVDFTLAGQGQLSAQTATTDAGGRACTGYLPPAQAPGVVEVLGASVTEGERTSQASLAITVEPPAAAQVFAGDWVYHNAQTQTDRAGQVVPSGTYTLDYNARVRVRRELDGTWRGEMIMGGGSASRGRACFLQEIEVFTGFVEVTSGLVDGTERVTITYTSDYTPALDGVCQIGETREVTGFFSADRQPDGSYRHDEIDGGSDVQISPEDGSVISSTSYEYSERLILEEVR